MKSAIIYSICCISAFIAVMIWFLPVGGSYLLIQMMGAEKAKVGAQLLAANSNGLSDFVHGLNTVVFVHGLVVGVLLTGLFLSIRKCLRMIGAHMNKRKTDSYAQADVLGQE